MIYYGYMVNVGRTKIVVLASVVIMLLGGFVWMSNAADSEKTIKIGFIGPLTGEAASYGKPISYAVEIAAEVLNQNGGMQGKRVEIFYEDGHCGDGEGVAARRAVERLLNENGVKIIIGGTCSGETLAILPITEKEKVLLVSPSSSSPDLTGAGEYFFRNTPSDTKGGEKLAQLIVEKYGYSKVAVISEETEYAQGFARTFKESVEAVGGEIVADENFAPEADDFRSILTKIKESGAEALFINPQTEVAGGSIIKQAREIGITAEFFASNVPSTPRALEIAGKHAEGLIFVDGPGLSQGSTKAHAFLNEFRSQYGDPGIEFYAGAAYDIVFILAEVIEEVGLHTGKIKDYLKSGESFSGVAGTYRFNEDGDPEGIDFVIKEIKDGKIVIK